ncbi:MAG: DUF503 domain-containing protein [Spirochaetales bacterium]|jgi:uncharacterized protein YlxP (DUF503 family)|nr:DUF503 domain-containing protein [Spirochaetales bacterium]
MLQGIIQLEGITSLKEKRRVVNSVKQRLRNKFYVSAAEVDLHDSLSFFQIGVALVTNDVLHGRRVMQKVMLFLEDQVPGVLYDVEFHSEEFGS